MKKAILVLLAILVINSCGKVNSDSTRAELVMSPAAGYRCFAIIDNDGKAVGGNCSKE